MLLGFNSFSFTTTEARAQAGGGGGGNRAVTITATTNTPGITVSGPIEEGFDEGVSAFLVEFTPPNPGDEPPEHASVSIAITPVDGWTLQQPNPANPAVVRQTPRGDFAAPLEWAAGLLVDGQQEDDASGKVEVVWPWAEFQISQYNPEPGPPFAIAREGAEDVAFHIGVGIDLSCLVTINVIPDNLPENIRDTEAKQWRTGWIQNMRSMGGTVYYPHILLVDWWETEQKANMPILDTASPVDPEADHRWYLQGLPPEPFQGDGSVRFPIMSDTPQMWDLWYLEPEDEDNPGDPAERLATRINLVHQFRAWLVVMRGEKDDAVIEWLNWVDWRTNLRVNVDVLNADDPNVLNANGPTPSTGLGLSIDPEFVPLTHGPINAGKGDLEPDLDPPPLHDILKVVQKERED